MDGKKTKKEKTSGPFLKSMTLSCSRKSIAKKIVRKLLKFGKENGGVGSAFGPSLQVNPVGLGSW